MTAEDRIRWDKIYKERLTQPYPDPAPLLLQFTPPMQDEVMCRALDLAAGFGQNGLWLASQGYHTDIMDISRVALQRVRAEMAIRNLRNVNALQIDVDDIQLDANKYDIICVIRYLKRNLFPIMKNATKVGGRVIYETFNVRYLDLVPGFNPAFLLDVGELEAIFAGWQILHYEEDDHNSRLVAVKSL